MRQYFQEVGEAEVILLVLIVFESWVIDRPL